MNKQVVWIGIFGLIFGCPVAVLSQVREGWPPGAAASNGPVQLMGNAAPMPVVNWDYIFYAATWATEPGDPGPLGLDEDKKRELAWLKHQMATEFEKRRALEDGDEKFMMEYRAASKEKRLEMIALREELFSATPEIEIERWGTHYRAMLQKSEDTLSARELSAAREFALGAIFEQITFEQLFQNAQLNRVIELSNDERERLNLEVKKIAMELNAEIASLRAQAWAKLSSHLKADQVKALEATMALTSEKPPSK